jgi:hypothetical protein
MFTIKSLIYLCFIIHIRFIQTKFRFAKPYIIILTNAKSINPTFGRRMLSGPFMHNIERKQQEDHAGLRAHDQQGRPRRLTLILEAKTIITLPNPHHPRPPRPLRCPPLLPRHIQLQEKNLHDKTHQGHLPLPRPRHT